MKNFKSFRESINGEPSGLRELMYHARTTAGWFKPYFVDEDGALHMEQMAGKYKNFYTRIVNGWVSRDDITRLANVGNVRRVDRLVAADAIRKRLLADPETNRSRIARFRVTYMLYLSNPNSGDPYASPYVIWRNCMKEENKARRRQMRDLLEIHELRADALGEPPPAELLHHLERNPHLISNIDLIKPQVKWPNEPYTNAFFHGLKAAKQTMEAAAMARNVVRELLG